MSEAHTPIAYLKFWAYQQVTQDGNVNADEGLEVCREGEIGVDGVEAIPVYDTPQEAKINADLLEGAKEFAAYESTMADGDDITALIHYANASRILTSAIAKAQPVSVGVE